MPVDASVLATVDESEIALFAFDFEGRRLTAAKPLIFSVTFEPDDELYFAEGEFALFASGKTRMELTRDLSAALGMLWREYVRAPADDQTADALALRQRLIETFGEDRDAT